MGSGRRSEDFWWGGWEDGGAFTQGGELRRKTHLKGK